MTEHTILVALRLGIVAAGALAALWSLRLSLLSQDRRGTYLLLASGFGLVTLGAVVEGVLFEFARWSLLDAHTTEAFVGAAGFALVLLSILRSRV